MYAGKILGIVNARCKNAGKWQSMLKKYSDSSMQVEKILGFVNASWENARNRQCKVQECWEMTKYAEKYSDSSMQVEKKYSESSMQGARMLGNDKVCWKMDGIVKARWKNARISSMYAGKNTRSRKCTQEKYSESSMQGVRRLGNDKVRRKNTRNRQCKVGKCSELSMQGERMLGVVDVCRKNTRNR